MFKFKYRAFRWRVDNGTNQAQPMDGVEEEFVVKREKDAFRVAYTRAVKHLQPTFQDCIQVSVLEKI